MYSTRMGVSHAFFFRLIMDWIKFRRRVTFCDSQSSWCERGIQCLFFFLFIPIDFCLTSMTLLKRKSKTEKHVRRSSQSTHRATGDHGLGCVKEWESRLPHLMSTESPFLVPDADEAFDGNNGVTDASLLHSSPDKDSLLSLTASVTGSVNDPERRQKEGVRDSNLVSRVRDLLTADFHENPSLYDENDVKHFVMEGNEHIIKFLDRFRSTSDAPNCRMGDEGEDQQVIEKTVTMMKSCLKWRKGCTLSSLNDLSFPIEFYRIGGLFIWTTDCFNNRLLVFRLKVYQNIPQLKEGMELFTTYLMFKAHDESVRDHLNGWSIIFDLTDVTIAQCDLPQLFWLINTFLSYFPKSLKQAYVYNLPWVFKRLAAFVLNFVPQEWRLLVKFVSGDEITQYVPRDRLPDYMNGTCRRSYRQVPRGARPVHELAFEKYGMSQAECDKILKHFERFLPDDNENEGCDGFIRK